MENLITLWPWSPSPYVTCLIVSCVPSLPEERKRKIDAHSVCLAWMGTYSFVKSVRRSQSDVSICHIRMSGCVCCNSAQISLIRTPSKRKPVTHFLEYVQRLQYLNQLFRNLCQRYEVRLWHIPFNQFHTVWIDYAPCLRYFIQTKIACDQKKTALLGENWTCVMFQSLVYTCPVFFWRQIWSFDFLSSARWF